VHIVTERLYGCHLCSERSDWVGQNHVCRCKSWCNKPHIQNNLKIPCRQKKTYNEETLLEMNEEASELEIALGEYKAGLKLCDEKSKISTTDNPLGVTY
jgi:hypothetical protein